MFRKMYYILAAAVCDAIECTDKASSNSILINALQETEDIYINYNAKPEKIGK